MKDIVSSFDVPVPIFTFDRDKDQFLALRTDSANLLLAYGQILRAKVIPGYQYRPESGIDANGILDPATKAALMAKENINRPIYKQNHLDNLEQSAMEQSIRWLRYMSAPRVMMQNFCWPPDDDQTVSAILDLFPPRDKSREQFLAELDLVRPYRVSELQKQGSNEVYTKHPTP